MIHEAIDTVETVFWAAIVSFAFMTACAAYLTIAAGYWVCTATIRATRSALAHLRYRRDVRHDRQHMARLSDAINQAPLIPTQPGTDQDLLNACWDAWNTDTRKEN